MVVSEKIVDLADQLEQLSHSLNDLLKRFKL
jgi:hypothetical protein